MQMSLFLYMEDKKLIFSGSEAAIYRSPSRLYVKVYKI
jgi:hypothetical protein